MRRPIKTLTVTDLLMQLLRMALQPAGGPQQDELPEHEPEEPPRGAMPAHLGPELVPIPEPVMPAVNGYVRLIYKDGRTQRLYVGHSPGYIAERIKEAIKRGDKVYTYWDRPGSHPSEAHKIHVFPRLIANAHPEYIEADIKALYDDRLQYLP